MFRFNVEYSTTPAPSIGPNSVPSPPMIVYSIAFIVKSTPNTEFGSMVPKYCAYNPPARDAIAPLIKSTTILA